MSRVVKVMSGAGYTLNVVFADGTQGSIDMTARLWGPMFEPLKDPAVFLQVKVDEFGAVCWPNGADLAPDALYQTIRSTENSVLAL